MSFLVSVIKPLAYLSVPAVMLRSIAARSSVARYYIKVGLYVGTMTVVAACSIVVAAGMSIVGQRFDVNCVVARTFYTIARRVISVNIVVEGEENLATRPGVIMNNHQSMLDILVVGRLIPRRASIMAKKSLQYTPLGPFMTMAGALFVDRGNNARAVRSLEAAGEIMKEKKVSMWIFPEGTRTSSEIPNMLPFKKGGFHLAIQAGIPIIPIVTEDYWRIYRKGVFEDGTIKVRVLPPIPTTGLTAADVPALISRVRDQMLDVLRDISVPVPSGKTEKFEETSRGPQSHTPQIEPPTSEAQTPSTPSVSSEVAPETSRRSSISNLSSVSASTLLKSEMSDRGAETEEDEGMILVGRPT